MVEIETPVCAQPARLAVCSIWLGWLPQTSAEEKHWPQKNQEWTEPKSSSVAYSYSIDTPNTEQNLESEHILPKFMENEKFCKTNRTIYDRCASTLWSTHLVDGMQVSTSALASFHIFGMTCSCENYSTRNLELLFFSLLHCANLASQQLPPRLCWP